MVVGLDVVGRHRVDDKVVWRHDVAELVVAQTDGIDELAGELAVEEAARRRRIEVGRDLVVGRHQAGEAGRLAAPVGSKQVIRRAIQPLGVAHNGVLGGVAQLVAARHRLREELAREGLKGHAANLQPRERRAYLRKNIRPHEAVREAPVIDVAGKEFEPEERLMELPVLHIGEEVEMGEGERLVFNPHPVGSVVREPDGGQPLAERIVLLPGRVFEVATVAGLHRHRAWARDATAGARGEQRQAAKAGQRRLHHGWIVEVHARPHPRREVAAGRARVVGGDVGVAVIHHLGVVVPVDHAADGVIRVRGIAAIPHELQHHQQVVQDVGRPVVIERDAVPTGVHLRRVKIDGHQRTRCLRHTLYDLRIERCHPGVVHA